MVYNGGYSVQIDGVCMVYSGVYSVQTDGVCMCTAVAIVYRPMVSVWCTAVHPPLYGVCTPYRHHRSVHYRRRCTPYRHHRSVYSVQTDGVCMVYSCVQLCIVYSCGYSVQTDGVSMVYSCG